MNVSKVSLLPFLLFFALFGGRDLLAWGPHVQIGIAALEVLDEDPASARWREILGEKNYRLLGPLSTIGDAKGNEYHDMYVDDVVMVRGLKSYHQHYPPELLAVYGPHFRRCLAALRTETPFNAIRQIGPLLHYVQDTGAPNHYGKPNKGFDQAINTFSADQIKNVPGKGDKIHIKGFKPTLLGKTDAEAEQALLDEMNRLWIYSKDTALKAQALSLEKPDAPPSPEVEQMILDNALASAQASANLLYTLFTLGLADQPEGAKVEGTIVAPNIQGYNQAAARVALLNAQAYDALTPEQKKTGDFSSCMTDYVTLALTAPTGANPNAWQGSFLWHHIPAGTYRLLAIRPGADWIVTDPVSLEIGKTSRLDVKLPDTTPAGNILMNPTGALSYLYPGSWDRWSYTGTVGFKVSERAWMAHRVKMTPGVTYRYGAVLKDPSVKIWFSFRGVDPIQLEPGQTNPPEGKFTAADKDSRATVVIETSKSLPEVLEKVWLAPE